MRLRTKLKEENRLIRDGGILICSI